MLILESGMIPFSRSLSSVGELLQKCYEAKQKSCDIIFLKWLPVEIKHRIIYRAHTHSTEYARQDAMFDSIQFYWKIK